MRRDSSDTGFVGLDFRAEPVVVSVPDVPDRYYVMQFTDFFTHNFAYIGTRTTGDKSGNYLFLGPKWEGEIPEDTFDGVFHCETDTAVAVVRTQVRGDADLPNVAAVQQGYKVMPLSVFLGEQPKPPLSLDDWPAWDQQKASSIGFIEYLNFVLALAEPIHPQDRPALERFAKIAIGPGRCYVSVPKPWVVSPKLAMEEFQIKKKSYCFVWSSLVQTLPSR